MKIVSTCAIFASSLLLAGAVHAQQAPKKGSDVYAELGYTWLDYGSGVRPTAIRGIVGYNAHRNVAIEGMAAFGASSDNAFGTDVKLRSAYGIFVKPKVDIDQFELFARLGWAHQRVRATAGGFSANASDSDFAWGLGASYNFTPNVYGSLDYMRLSGSGRNDALTLGVGYRF